MATRTWKTAPGTTAWALASNWVEGAVPTTNDDVIIPGGYNASIDFSSSAVAFGSLTVQSGAGAGVTFIGTALITVSGGGASRVFTLQSNTKWNATGTISFTSTLGCDITAPVTSAIQASFTLGSATTTAAAWKLLSYIFVASTKTLTLTGGTLNLNDNTFEIGLFTSTGTVTRSIVFGSSGQLLLTSATTSTVFSMTTGTGFTYTGNSYIVIQASTGVSTTSTTRTINTTGLTATNCMSFAFRNDKTYAAVYGTYANDFITIITDSYFLNLDLAGETGGYANSRVYSGTLNAAVTRYVVGHLFLNSYNKLAAPSTTHSIIFADGTTSSNTIVSTNSSTVKLGTPASYAQGTSITIAASGITNSSTATNVITSGTTYFVAATTVNTTTVTLSSNVKNAYYDLDTSGVLIFSTSTVGGTNTVSVGTVKSVDFGGVTNVPTVAFSTGSSSYYITNSFATVYDLLINTRGTVYIKDPDFTSGYQITVGRNLTQTNGTLWNDIGGNIYVTGVISWTNGTFVFADGDDISTLADYITCNGITITAPYTINVDPYNINTATSRSFFPAHITLLTGKPTIVGTPTILKGRKFGFLLNSGAALSAIADTTGLFSYTFNGSGSLSMAGMVMRDVNMDGHSGVIAHAASYTVKGSFSDYANSYAAGTTVGGTITLSGSGGTVSDPDYISMSAVTRQNLVITGSYYRISLMNPVTVGYVQFNSGTVYTSSYGFLDVNALYVTIAPGVNFYQGTGARFTVNGSAQTVFNTTGCNFLSSASMILSVSSAATSGTRTIDCRNGGRLFNVSFTYPDSTPARDTVSILAGTTFNSFDASAQNGTLSIPSMSVVENFASSGDVGVVSGTLTLINSDPNASNICVHNGAASPSFNVIFNGRNTVGTTLIGNAGTAIGTVTVNSGTVNVGGMIPSALTVNSGTVFQMPASYSYINMLSGSISINPRAVVICSPNSTISMQGTGAHTFAGGSHTFGILDLAGTGAVTITGNNTFNQITNSSIPCTLYLTSGTTTTMTTFNIQGSAASRSRVSSTSTSGRAKMVKPSRWAVGTTSTLVSTTGLFLEAAPPVSYINFSYIDGLVVVPPLNKFIAHTFLNFF